MSLLDPINLVYLASVAALIAIYLRARSRPTLEVSSLFLFEEASAPVARVRVLRLDRLFWLEALALCALSLALAGLYLKLPHRPEQGRRHALIFDLGAGMSVREGSRTRLDEARREALAIVDRASAGDQFSVIGYALDAEVRQAWSTNRDAVRAAIAGLAPMALAVRPAALQAALLHAAQADEADVFTDRPVGQMPASALANVHVNRIGSRDDNLAIVALDPGIVKQTEGRCTLRNFSTRPHLTDLVIDRDGSEILRAPVMLEPRGQAIVPFGPLMAGGLLRARILAADALAADNQRYAYAQSERALRAIVLSPDADARDDLARVLIAVDENFEITAADPAKLPAQALGGQSYALAVIHDCDPPPINSAALLLVFPKDSAKLRVSSVISLAELQDRGPGQILAAPLPIGPARSFAAPEWMDVVARGIVAGSSSPFAIAAVGGDQSERLGVIGFDVRGHLLLNPDRLDALVLTVDLIKALTAPRELQIAETGSWVTVAVGGTARIVAPDGSQRTVKPDRWGRVRLRPTQAGRYAIQSGEQNLEVYANYFDAAESDLVSRPERSGAPIGSAAASVGAPAAVPIQPLGWWMIAIALAAVVAESVLMLRSSIAFRGGHV